MSYNYDLANFMMLSHLNNNRKDSNSIDDYRKGIDSNERCHIEKKEKYGYVKSRTGDLLSLNYIAVFSKTETYSYIDKFYYQDKEVDIVKDSSLIDRCDIVRHFTGKIVIYATLFDGTKVEISRIRKEDSRKEWAALRGKRDPLPETLFAPYDIAEWLARNRIVIKS